MKKVGFIFSILFLLAGCHKGPSNIKLPSLIGDNMLLQQNSDVRIWGSASPGQKIAVSASWDAFAQAISDKDGNWSVIITASGAGGPHTITISARDTSIIINNILLGEVWICSGQSNMEMPVAGWPPSDTIMHSATTIASASVPEIRLYSVQRKVSGEPLEDCIGRWVICSPSTVSQFSATAYFFGKKLHEELNVPIGLILSAWGGTPVEAWMSSEALENSGEFISEIRGIKESIPLLAKYQSWLEGHNQLVVSANGEDQWRNLSFNDEKVPLPGYDDSKWPVITLPGQFESTTGDFDGAVWFRRSVGIPAEMAGKDLIISLGPIDDMDMTYFNGILVGSNEVSGFWQAERNYDIPGKLVKEGSNTIAVRVLDNQGGGGIWGKPGSMGLSLRNNRSKRISLDGKWQFQPVAELMGNKFYIFNLENNDFLAVERPVIIGASTPSALFNGMIKPLTRYTIKGAIWYQGEANVGREEQYSRIFPVMIQNWRDAWGIKDFPYYYVQIAPYIYSGLDSTESAFLREAQEKALILPNTGMVVTLDISTVMNIHPPYKKEVGERLAILALAKNYGKEIKFRGPEFKSMTIEGPTIKLQFDFIEGGLYAKDYSLTEFEIAGENGKYVKANAKIVGNEVWVTNPAIERPSSVRYCWRNGSTASLFNSEGLPALQFRTKE